MTREQAARPAWQGLAYAILYAFVALGVISLLTRPSAEFVAWMSGSDPTVVLDRLDQGLRYATTVWSLTIAEALAAVLMGGIAVAVLGRRSIGLTAAGTWRGFRLAVPMLAVMVGVPAALSLVAGQDLLHDSITLHRGLALIAFALAIGVFEEVVFRGGVVEFLGGRAAPVFAVVGSALIFGAPHLGNGSWGNPVAVTLAVGIPYALIRCAGGSILGLALAHAVIDIHAFLKIGDLRVPPATTLEQALQVAAASLVAVGYVAWYVRSERRGGHGRPRSS
jgi:membrane protease YdiL (CAAX protease family)